LSQRLRSHGAGGKNRSRGLHPLRQLPQTQCPALRCASFLGCRACGREGERTPLSQRLRSHGAGGKNRSRGTSTRASSIRASSASAACVICLPTASTFSHSLHPLRQLPQTQCPALRCASFLGCRACGREGFGPRSFTLATACAATKEGGAPKSRALRLRKLPQRVPLFSWHYNSPNNHFDAGKVSISALFRAPWGISFHLRSRSVPSFSDSLGGKRHLAFCPEGDVPPPTRPLAPCGAAGLDTGSALHCTEWPPSERPPGRRPKKRTGEGRLPTSWRRYRD
jgi:hypothetical protein